MSKTNGGKVRTYIIIVVVFKNKRKNVSKRSKVQGKVNAMSKL